MSRKYDFGYEIETGSTNEWAYNQILENSIVLELGAAVGNLTKHLKEDKNCLVDIVEIDCESGVMAAEFARTSLLGEVEGNLNNEIWYDKLAGNKYDYVVALDVLEHLEDPRQVLGKVKKLLAENGKVIVSIPNIANNAVLINLFNDRFEYTELGLLDRTHRYFMTYYTILELAKSLEYNIDSIDAIEKEVGTSEIFNSYADLPEEVAYFLKKRNLGLVYQYLFVFGTKDVYTENKLKESNEKDNLHTSLVLFDGLSRGMVKIENSGEKIAFALDIPKDTKSIRFVPIEHACIITELRASVWRGNSRFDISPNWNTGMNLTEGTILFGKESQEINWALDGTEQKIEISCGCKILFESMLPIFDACKNAIQKKDIFIKEKESEFISTEIGLKKQLQEKERELISTEIGLKKQLQEKERELISTEIELKKQLQEKESELISIEAELDNIKQTSWYKLANKMSKIRRKK